MRTKTSTQSGLDVYFQKISKIPILSTEEETELCYKVKHENDSKAKGKLFRANLRLVVFIVNHEFKGYKFLYEDLIQEGSIGLLGAIERYDSSLGGKFSTYISLCIKWKIYVYILKNFKQINISRTTLHVKLFFKLRKLKAKIHLPAKEEREYIAESIGASIKEIESMEMALYGKYYSYDPVKESAEDEDEDEYSPAKHLHALDNNPADIAEKQEYQSYIIDALVSRLNKMPERDRDIIINRYFVDKPMTLEALGKYYKLTRERIRQIEKSAFEILKKLAKDLTKEI